jgi:hypothetical protein
MGAFLYLVFQLIIQVYKKHPQSITEGAFTFEKGYCPGVLVADGSEPVAAEN